MSIVYCYQDNIRHAGSSAPDKEKGKLDAHAVATCWSVNTISVHLCSANASLNKVRWIKGR